MREIKKIAYELSKGNVKKAAEIRLQSHLADPLMEMEVVEIAKQAIISFLKKGEMEKVSQTKDFFSLGDEHVEGAIKQAILSIYFDGDLERMLDIKHKIPLSLEVRKEIIDYCESWGRHSEAEAMKSVLLK